MTLKNAIAVVARLHENKVIASYALTGAVAALHHIQPALTEDLDILISVDGFEKRPSGLLLLTPIEAALAEMGYSERSDLGYMIEGWPVQFLPAASPLDEEALRQAIEIEVAGSGGVPTKAFCLRAEHLAAIALRTGRLKDLARIEAFLEQGAVEFPAFKSVLERHKLFEAWRHFCVKAGRKDPLQG